MTLTNKGRSRKSTFDIYWAPEGRLIATVEAVSAHNAKRQAPQPYSKYAGETWAWEVLDTNAKCTINTGCPRHNNHNS